MKNDYITSGFTHRASVSPLYYVISTHSSDFSTDPTTFRLNEISRDGLQLNNGIANKKYVLKTYQQCRIYFQCKWITATLITIYRATAVDVLATNDYLSVAIPVGIYKGKN